MVVARREHDAVPRGHVDQGDVDTGVGERACERQALLLREDANVLRVAMESGFGSLSAFNKSFRKIAGMSPSDFRRDARDMPMLSSDALAS